LATIKSSQASASGLIDCFKIDQGLDLLDLFTPQGLTWLAN
jgi:hypothetical protein